MASSTGRGLRKVWGWFPLTFLGLLVVGAAIAVFVLFGEGKADYVLYTAGLVALAIVGVATVTTIAAAARLGWTLRRQEPGLPEEIETDATVRTGLRLPNLSWWPLVDLRLAWETPQRVEARMERQPTGVRELVVFRRRGRVHRIVRRFTLRDVFGLTSLTFSKRWEAASSVVPSRGDASLTMALRQVGGDAISHPAGEPDGEMIEMRRYQYGDPVRHILWKTYARTRQLLVRQPERAIAPKPSTLALLVAGEADEPSASTARVFVEDGLLGDDFVFGADGAVRLARDPHEALDQIIDSGDHMAASGTGLGELTRGVEPVRLDNCIIFVPALAGAWVDRVTAFARTLRIPPTVVVTIDGRLAERGRSRFQRFLWAAPAVRESPDQAALRGAAELYERLRATGLDVRILHRSSGRVMGPQQLAALRGV